MFMNPINYLANSLVENQSSTKELDLERMYKLYQYATNPNFTPFKLKKIKSGSIYTINSPIADEIVNYVNNTHPIPHILLRNPLFKFSESIHAVHQYIFQLSQSMNSSIIEPMYLNNPNYINMIKAHFENFIINLKRHSTLKKTRRDIEDRAELIKEICVKNSSTVRKLLKKEHRFIVNEFSYHFDIKDIDTKDLNLVEENLASWIHKTVNKFYQINQTDLLTLFYRVQKLMSGIYQFKIFFATTQDLYGELTLMQFFEVDSNQNMNIALGIDAKITCDHFTYAMDIQGIDGSNQKIWDKLWKQIISQYSYFYYESKYISPEFIYLDGFVA